MSNTNLTAQQVVISAQVNFGLSDFANALILNYQEPNTTTCLSYAATAPQVVLANTNNVAFNLQSIFSAINTAVLIGFVDISNPGQQVNWGLASSGPRFYQNPSGFTLIRTNQAIATLPTVYIDNPSANMNALLQFFCLAN